METVIKELFHDNNSEVEDSIVSQQRIHNGHTKIVSMQGKSKL
jgi:hypothetical protein